MRRLNFLSVLLVMAATSVNAAERYSGPRPPKPDVPYLVHADNLIETEIGTAKNDTRKDATIAVIDGAASPVKTPLMEPAFLLQTGKLTADKLHLYKLESKNGKREVVINHKKTKNVSRPIYTVVTKLDDKLYRIEVDEPLENGEYSLSPDESDQTFSFAVY